MFEAVSNGDERRVRSLSWDFANMSATDPSSGRTPSHEAARCGRANILSLLSDLNAEQVWDKDSSKWVPSGQPTLNFATRDHGGRLPAHYAGSEGHEMCLTVLHKLAPRSIFEPDDRGRLVAHGAAQNGHERILEQLIQLGGGSTLMATDKDGRTPAHEAARFNQKHCLEFLATAGADLSVEDKAKKTPAQSALDRGHVDLCRWLQSRPAAIASRPSTSFMTQFD